MRTLGPGSIASLLKIALDVAYAVLWIALVIIALAAAAGLLSVPFLMGGSHVVADGGREEVAAYVRRWPLYLASAVAVFVYLGVLLIIIFRLRQVFATLIAGDPFRPENVGRLRIVGLALIALEAAGILVRLTLAWSLPDAPGRGGLSVSLSGWFAILVVFVLAEVFREGARLRRDAELTI